MSWFRAKSSNFAELNKKIFESAALSADPTIKYLRNKLGGETKEFQHKFVPVMFEFLHFFIHLANRSAFAQLGAENSPKLSQKLVEHLVDSMVETLMGHWPNNLKQGMKTDFSNNYNIAEGDYATCRAIYLSPEEDTKTEEKLANGKKSKSMVGQLVDNVSEILTGKVNTDPFLLLTVPEGVLSMLKKNMKEIDALIIASKFNS
jgi:hypothetical protein